MKANQEKTQVESDNWLNFNQIKKFHNKWQKITLANVKLKGLTYEFQRFLILSLYVLLPPRRLDYSGVEIVTELEYLKLPVQAKRKNTYPYLEVKNKTATIEHEATTSRISADQLFYLSSRGMSMEDAISTLVNGFCKEVFKELPLEFSVEAVKLIEMKLENSVG